MSVMLAGTWMSAAAEVGRLQLPVLVEDVAAVPISMVRSRVRINRGSFNREETPAGHTL